RLAVEVAEVRRAADSRRLGRADAAQLRQRIHCREDLVPVAQRLLGGELEAQQPQVARVAGGKVLQHREGFLVPSLRDQEVGERREARLVHVGRGTLRLVEELLALAEAAELVCAARRDDRGYALRLLAHKRRGGALLGRGIAALEKREQGVIERAAQARARALGAIGAHTRGNRDQRRHQAREEVER